MNYKKSIEVRPRPLQGKVTAENCFCHLKQCFPSTPPSDLSRLSTSHRWWAFGPSPSLSKWGLLRKGMGVLNIFFFGWGGFSCTLSDGTVLGWFKARAILTWASPMSCPSHPDLRAQRSNYALCCFQNNLPNEPDMAPRIPLLQFVLDSCKCWQFSWQVKGQKQATQGQQRH